MRDKYPILVSRKKKTAASILVLLFCTLTFVPMGYIGDPRWSAYAVILVLGIIYVKWFMKD